MEYSIKSNAQFLPRLKLWVSLRGNNMSDYDDRLNDLVETVVEDFVYDAALFTALDVSNKVKETMPTARHRQIRDTVRGLFTDVIEPLGYGRTPITVNLEDGSTAEALLYHPLVDSWDLDAKYDAQQRAKTSARPSNVKVVSSPTTTVSTAADLNDSLQMKIGNVLNTVTAPVVVQQKSSIDEWDDLFASKPSLFPGQ